MELYGLHFVYDDFPSSAYNLIFGNVSTSEYLNIRGSTTGRYIVNKRTGSREYIGEDKGESHLTFDIEIVTTKDECMSVQEVRDVERWLFGSNKFRVMSIDPNDYTEVTNEESEFMFFNGFSGMYLMCRFSNPEKIIAFNGVVGFKCTLEASTDMWLQNQEVKIEIPEDSITDVDVTDDDDNVIGTVQEFSFDCDVEVDSDSNGYTYPVIEITCDNNSRPEESPRFIDIWNSTDVGTDDRMFSISDIDGVVYIDCSMCYVSGGTVQNPAGYNNVRSHSFTRLLSGNNTLSIYGSGIIGISMTWKNKKFM